MKRIILALCAMSATGVFASDVTPPQAKKVPHELSQHGVTRVDPYYWLRDDSRTDEAILAHLTKENAYADALLAPTEALQAQLYEEMKQRIAKDDSSVPVQKGAYFYWSETKGNDEYRRYYRSRSITKTEPELLFNLNDNAAKHDYYSLGDYAVSPNDTWLAYTEDTLSRRVYTLRIKALKDGKHHQDVLTGVASDIIWSKDSKHLYYLKKDPQTLLSYQVFRHTLGEPQSKDVLVYEEQDKSYYTWLSKSKDGEVMYIGHDSTLSAGVSLVDLQTASTQAQRFIPRTANLEYSVAKHQDSYFIRTNYNAVNFQLMQVAADKLGDIKAWQTVIPGQDDAQFVEFELFREHLVYVVREQGLVRVRVRDLNSQKDLALSFNDRAYRAQLKDNYTLEADAVRVAYSSMTTPNTLYEIDLATGKSKRLKQQKVMGDFNADDYQSERFMVPARDGAKVPVSLVYKKSTFKKDGTNPLYVYGYGSYGSTIDPRFSSSRLSLLNRGFVFAIIHPRGSQMLGRPWYEQGKMGAKRNTFNDFIDATKALVSQGYGAADKVVAAGGSAGGLLMGVIINEAPELYHAVAAHVPFVDVVTTMSDASIPLTTNEYDEWGNPANKAEFDYMLSYSPYDQIKSQAYPNLLVTTGLHDSQVQYFEPAKWVQKLRDHQQGDAPILFKVDMTAGHGGASGRFAQLKDRALEYAFFIHAIEQVTAKQ